MALYARTWHGSVPQSARWPDVTYRFPVATTNQTAACRHAGSASLTHWGHWNKMANIWQTAFLNAISGNKMYVFCLRFCWNMLIRVQLINKLNSIASVNGLGPEWQQAITWSNNNPVGWQIHAPNVLTLCHMQTQPIGQLSLIKLHRMNSNMISLEIEMFLFKWLLLHLSPTKLPPSSGIDRAWISNYTY